MSKEGAFAMAQVTRLSAREQAVVELLLEGKSNKQIALVLGISARTVEFHLKNIYAKSHVSSRIELILKLGNTTGSAINEKLVESTVESLGKTAENRGRLNAHMDWARSFRVIVPIIGKEFGMKDPLSIKHVLVGVVTALLAGFSWLALFIYYGNLTVDGIKAWSIPLVIILAVIGGSIGLIGRRNHSALRKVFFSALFGTSLSLFSVIPLMLIVVLPLEKLAIQVGLPDPFASSIMASDVSNLVGTITIITIWLVVGVAVGTTLLFVSISKPERINNQILESS
jgi:DNA-binding CsgD family transcriptional regulator